MRLIKGSSRSSQTKNIWCPPGPFGAHSHAKKQSSSSFSSRPNIGCLPVVLVEGSVYNHVVWQDQHLRASEELLLKSMDEQKKLQETHEAEVARLEGTILRLEADLERTRGEAAENAASRENIHHSLALQLAACKEQDQKNQDTQSALETAMENEAALANKLKFQESASLMDKKMHLAFQQQQAEEVSKLHDKLCISQELNAKKESELAATKQELRSQEQKLTEQIRTIQGESDKVRASQNGHNDSLQASVDEMRRFLEISEVHNREVDRQRKTAGQLLDASVRGLEISRARTALLQRRTEPGSKIVACDVQAFMRTRPTPNALTVCPAKAKYQSDSGGLREKPPGRHDLG